MISSPTLVLARREFRRLSGGSALFRLDPALPSFEIAREGGRWIFSGPSETELLYAVYDCAERFLGYDFFEPGTENFDPARVEKELPEGVLVPARRPLLRYRGFIQEFPFDEKETPRLFDFMAKNKLNYLLVWMKYYDELAGELKEYAACRGIVIESGHHDFAYLVPYEKYGRGHPEYFAVRPGRDGEKALPGVTHAGHQLCTTEPGLRKEIAKRLLAYAEKHPELRRIGLNPDDGFGWCQCSRCRRYYQPDDRRKCLVPAHAAHYFYAENAYDEFIAEAAKRVHVRRPDLVLNFFGYVNYSSPAKNFRLTPGIAVQLANYWRCVQHDLADRACPTNRGFLNDLLAWEKAKAGGELMIYEYYMGINFYMSLPLLFGKRMFDELAFYRAHKVDGVLTQFQTGHWSVYGGNYRFMAEVPGGRVSKRRGSVFSAVVFRGWSLRRSIFSPWCRMWSIPSTAVTFRRRPRFSAGSVPNSWKNCFLRRAGSRGNLPVSAPPRIWSAGCAISSASRRSTTARRSGGSRLRRCGGSAAGSPAGNTGAFSPPRCSII
ncbi:MAG: DUF4838 domain-containing protein [Lentisphaeria bacterium]|nr:DUF4838 domain-containing protein [Lentisphaeria bacterium]